MMAMQKLSQVVKTLDSASVIVAFRQGIRATKVLDVSELDLDNKSVGCLSRLA
jgi:hypothetical protein